MIFCRGDGKAPKFIQKPGIKQEKGLLVMTCVLEAKPIAKITWFRDTTEVSAGGRIVIKADSDPKNADRYTLVLQIKVCHFIHY